MPGLMCWGLYTTIYINHGDTLWCPTDHPSIQNLIRCIHARGYMVEVHLNSDRLILNNDDVRSRIKIGGALIITQYPPRPYPPPKESKARPTINKQLASGQLLAFGQQTRRNITHKIWGVEGFMHPTSPFECNISQGGHTVLR